MICGRDGCKNISTGIWRITDSFGRVYEKDACDECAVWWKQNRLSCVLVKRLEQK